MRTLFLALIFFSSLSFAKAQQMTTYADTSKYLINEIEGKKSRYVGQPFSVLLNELKLTPVRILQGDWYGLDADLPKFGKRLYIYFNYDRVFHKTHFILVKFKTQPSLEVIYPLFFQDPKTATKLILEAYKNTIVTYVGAKLYEQDDSSIMNEKNLDDD
ncbi:hypothetical protein BWD42_07670 [Sphingobacterium sp. CZ-UAM]|uniref:hypothetical protein n=1 Tax=Sphingobacterium sp. CZ-UAM TaxID=1933868 RepID=UPI000986262B|nr:hypothetical protein [Sphingobacterium sp. CZ-UAM]OOG19769.1 hypothetical protein BWD42_07670 [Sphingobacterium sp. CZ-UAM]